MRTTLLLTIALAGGSLALAACGQRGPLYLPTPKPAAQTAAPAPAADGSAQQKKTTTPAQP